MKRPESDDLHYHIIENMNLKTSNQKRNDGSALSNEDIQELRSSVKGTVVVKTEASKAEYDDAVKRWNAVSIRLAVGFSARINAI